MNETNEFNLIDEQWIPVLMKSGENRTISLGDVFGDSVGDIADLALNPYERVAVFRLLLCIAQAALGPDLLKDETAWLAAKSAVGPVSIEYLKKWHDRFFLYGPHAFLQPDCIIKASEKSQKPCSNLIFEFASGNNSTLFDHEAKDSDCRLLANNKLVLGLLVYLNFSAGGGSPQCIWDGEVTPFRGTSGAPCREQSMLFSILCGRSLLETIWLNMLSANKVETALCSEWGRPVWELDLLARNSVQCLARSFIGHLVPLSRAVKLVSGVALCNIGEGIKYPQLPEWREQMATVVMDNQGNLGYVSACPSRMPWRDLTSLLSIHPKSKSRSALSLCHLDSLSDDDVFTLWTGGLYWEPGQAKQIDTVEWSVTLPVSMLEEISMQRYEAAIVWADDKQRSFLRRAAKTYADLMKIDDASRFYKPAERAYWDILAKSENQLKVQDVDSKSYMDDWKDATRKAAEEAYRRACPAMTARQMEAFAQGFAKLWVFDDSKKKRKHAESGMADEEAE